MRQVIGMRNSELGVTVVSVFSRRAHLGRNSSGHVKLEVHSRHPDTGVFIVQSSLSWKYKWVCEAGTGAYCSVYMVGGITEFT